MAGDYESVAPSPAPEPLYPALLHARGMYRGAARAEREAKKELEEKVREEVKRLKAHQAKERREKLVSIAKYGIPFLNIGRHCLKLEHIEQLKELRASLRATLPPRRIKRFSDWLKNQRVPFHALYAVTHKDIEKAGHTPAPMSTEYSPFPQAKLFLE